MNRYTPYFNQTAMVKYFTYDNHYWVGYDDADTFKAKIDYASSHCIGGTMIWSIDFDPEVGGKPVSNGTDSNLIYVDPSIWEEPNPQIQCWFPCTLVLPPWPSWTTTLDYPLVTVSSESWTTTITHTPITESSWWISLITIEGPAKTTTSVFPGPTRTGGSVEVRTSTPTLSSSTWPPVYYSDPDGNGHKTTPPGPPPPITSPPGVKPPPITVHNTGPPSPTIDPFPLPCPPGKCPPGTNSDDNGDGSDDGNDDDDDDDDGDGDDGDDTADNDWEDEEDDVCVINGLPDWNGDGIGDVSAINGTMHEKSRRYSCKAYHHPRIWMAPSTTVLLAEHSLEVAYHPFQDLLQPRSHLQTL
jgi:hypothetical protein